MALGDGKSSEPENSLRSRLLLQQQAFLAEGPPSAAVRRHRIDRLVALLFENADALAQAMLADYGSRSPVASVMTEIVGIGSTIEYTRNNLERWMRPRRTLPGYRLFGVSAEVEPSPKGVVGIIGPWNFPVNLVALPAVEAFAAGNRVMIKMSEVTSHTAEVFADLAARYFDPSELDVVVGPIEVGAQFAALPFDHLFFTGSPSVGRLIQRAASEHLVPVTLELGGKNPVVVAQNADIDRYAGRIANARLVNGGQVCLCPDYVFVPTERVEEFCQAASAAIRRILPSVVNSPDFTSSVNDANYERVLGLLEDARKKGAHIISVAPPGETLPDRATRKIAPTLVTNVDGSMRITSDEIFGPLLVVMGYRALDEVITYINERPSPLAIYWYGDDNDDFRHLVKRTRSGGVSRNDFALHMAFPQTPFGGVGKSGMGAYHGKAGFDAFSHHRPVVGSALPFSFTGLAAPPYSRSKTAMAKFSVWSTRRKARRRLARFQQPDSDS
ncbi:coniferyl aldehyde dehydrogenase [Mycobacterium pyrenivorans]|nr:coniferyl aldehyde dehydrogenase [Mycolicibacterium pyrenivorans]